MLHQNKACTNCLNGSHLECLNALVQQVAHAFDDVRISVPLFSHSFDNWVNLGEKDLNGKVGFCRCIVLLFIVLRRLQGLNKHGQRFEYKVNFGLSMWGGVLVRDVVQLLKVG